jgi:hypothetical protein
MLDQLPPESSYRTAQRNRFTDDELAAMTDTSQVHGPWSHEASLLAALIDAIQLLTHVQISKAGVKQDPPLPVRRPGVTGRRRGSASPQARKYLERIREIHEQQLRAVEEGASE